MQKGFSEISWGALVMQLRNYNHAAQAWTIPQTAFNRLLTAFNRFNRFQLLIDRF